MKYNDNGTIKELKVKAFDTLPVGTEVDYDGSVVPDGWTEVEDPNTYSTDEVRIGTWIDGKPLYRKTVYISALPNNATGFYDIFSSNEIGNIKICFIDDSASFMTSTVNDITENDTMNWIYSTTAFVFTCIRNKQIRIITKDDKSNTSAYVSVKYTKTTD